MGGRTDADWNGNAKLTWEKVKRIRAGNGTSDAAFAIEYEVSSHCIRLVRLNQTWFDPDYTPQRARWSRRPRCPHCHGSGFASTQVNTPGDASTETAT